MCFYHHPTQITLEPEEATLDVPTDEEVTEEEDETEIIRAKWVMDDARTLDEAIEKLQQFVEHILALKAEGYELVGPIQDDYGFIRKTS